MSVVLDTTVLIDILRGRSEARGFYLGLREGPVCSELTRLEVLRGMRSDERSPTFRLLASLQWHGKFSLLEDFHCIMSIGRCWLYSQRCQT